VLPTEPAKGSVGDSSHRGKHDRNFNPVLTVLKSQLAQQPFRHKRLYLI